MAFYKRNEKKVSKEGDGIVYLLYMKVDGKDVVKIGVTSRLKIEERVVEILTSHFKKYRNFPYCRPKRFGRTSSIYDKEAQLHYHFKSCKYSPETKFDGSTEFFIVEDEKYLLDVYKRCLEGENLKDLEPYEVEDVLEEE